MLYTKPQTDTESISVLHVDDDPSILDISKFMLTEMDSSFVIESAFSVDDAFNKLNEKEYDVVISDYEMPHKNGLDFLRELKEKDSGLPFILFTGKGREEIAIQALNLGADGYYNKQGDTETVYGELVHGINVAVERKKIKRSLEESEKRFEKMVTNSKDLIMLTRADGTIVYLSPACKNILGYEPIELIGKKPWVVHSEDSERVQKIFQKALTTHLSGDVEYRLCTKQGQIKWVYHSFSQIMQNNQVKQLVSNITDITERKGVEALLRTSEGRFRSISESMADTLIEVDRSGRVTYINRLIPGFSFEQVLCSTVFDFVPCEQVPVVEKALEAIFKYGETARYESVRSGPNDESRIYEVNVSPILYGDNIVSAVFLERDITERKNTEDQLKESLKNYQSLINGMTETSWVIDFEGNFVEVNDAAVDMLGYSKDELLSIGISGIDRHLSRIQVQELINNLSFKKKQIFETVHTRKDGVEIPVEISSSLITYQGKQAILSIARNITERKKAEEEIRRSQRETKIVNEKLQVVGSLTRHDVGNKLMAARFNVYLLRKKLKDNPELEKYLDSIEESFNQSAKIFEFSKIYENIGSENPADMNVAEQFDEASKLIPHKDIQIISEVQGVTVLADSLLEQLFYNLIDNSLKHGKNVNRIRLCYEKTGDKIKLFYEDNGVGIPQENKKKIFSEGFTTGGSGIGLKLVKKMIEVYGWTISEEGTPGQGAKFVIAIPNQS